MPDNFWPDPLELMDMKDAVDARKQQAMVGDRLFNFHYQETTFHVSPVEGLVPRGYFLYDTAFDEIMAEEEDGR